MYKDNDLCPICGDGFLKEKIIRETFEYKDKYLSIDNYIVYECSVCEESLVDPKTLKDTEKVIRDFHREVDGFLTSEKIKKIRTSLGYTQEMFSSILGGGVKSFARYENGTVTQSKPMDNLLRIIKNFPYTLISLANREHEDVVYEPDHILWDIKKRKTLFLSGKSDLPNVTLKSETDGIIFNFTKPYTEKIINKNSFLKRDKYSTLKKATGQSYSKYPDVMGSIPFQKTNLAETTE